MRKFCDSFKNLIIRLDELSDHLIDSDAILRLGGKAAVTLKIIFDNIRCYPILYLIWGAIQLISRNGTILSNIAAFILALLLFFLGILVLLQTGLILLTTTAMVVSTLTGPQVSSHFREALQKKRLAYWLIIGTGMFITGFAWLIIGLELLKIASKSNLI